MLRLLTGLPAWHFLCQIPEIWHFLKWFGIKTFVWHIRHSLTYFGIFYELVFFLTLLGIFLNLAAYADRFD